MLRKKTRRHHVTYPYICNIHLRAQGNRRLYGALIGGGSDILQMKDNNPHNAVQNMHHQPSLQHSVTTDLRLWEALTVFDSLSLSLPLALSPRPVADLTGFCRSAQVLRSAQTAGRPRNHSMLRMKTRRHHVTYPYICNIHLRAQGNRCLYGALIGGGSDILHMNDTNPQHTTHSRMAGQNMHHQPRLQHSVTTGLRLWEPLTAFDSLSLSLPLALSPRPVADLTGFCRSAQVLRSAQTAGRPRNHSMLRKKTRRHHVTYPYICNIHLRAQGNRRLYGALIGGGSDILQMKDINPHNAVQNMHHQPSLQHSVTTDLRLWEALTAFDSLSLSRCFSPPRCGPHRLLQIRPGPALSTDSWAATKPQHAAEENKKTSRNVPLHLQHPLESPRESLPLRRSHWWRQ